ncbi:MAG: hypothetical protein KatS3mg109_0050 [Pirellulaceae bacterium]|nr:MAG: hypothetical protein KatS3mg109_0050 [Pirellulaceae bacterium]
MPFADYQTSNPSMSPGKVTARGADKTLVRSEWGKQIAATGTYADPGAPTAAELLLDAESNGGGIGSIILLEGRRWLVTVSDPPVEIGAGQGLKYVLQKPADGEDPDGTVYVVEDGQPLESMVFAQISGAVVYKGQFKLPVRATVPEPSVEGAVIGPELSPGQRYRLLVISPLDGVKNGVYEINANGDVAGPYLSPTGGFVRGGGSGGSFSSDWQVVDPPATPDRVLDSGSNTTIQDINRVLGTLILDLKAMFA